MSTFEEYVAARGIERWAKARADALKPIATAELNEAGVAKKVIRTPDGRKVAYLSVDQLDAEVKVTNETAFIAWCETHAPGLLETVEVPATTERRLKAAALKDFLIDVTEDCGYDSATGEEIPGLTYREAGPANFCKMSELDDAVLIDAIRSDPERLLAIGGDQ